MNRGDRSGVKYGRPILSGLPTVNQTSFFAFTLIHVSVSDSLHQYPQQLVKRPSSELINRTQKVSPKRERTQKYKVYQDRSEATDVLAVTDSFYDPESITSLWLTHLSDTVVEGGRVRIRPFQLKQSTILISVYEFPMLVLDTGVCRGVWRTGQQHAKVAKPARQT